MQKVRLTKRITQGDEPIDTCMPEQLKRGTNMFSAATTRHNTCHVATKLAKTEYKECTVLQKPHTKEQI